MAEHVSLGGSAKESEREQKLMGKYVEKYKKRFALLMDEVIKECKEDEDVANGCDVGGILTSISMTLTGNTLTYVALHYMTAIEHKQYIDDVMQCMREAVMKSIKMELSKNG